MSDKAFILRPWEVHGLIAGRATQFRRWVKPQFPADWQPVVGPYHPTIVDRFGIEQPGAELFGVSDENYGVRCPWQPGDALVGKETWTKGGRGIVAHYRADNDGHVAQAGWRSPAIMPAWASRWRLTVTEVRCQRLGDISDADADASAFGGDWPHRVFPDQFGDDDSGLSIPECFTRLWLADHGDCDPMTWVWAITVGRGG